MPRSIASLHRLATGAPGSAQASQRSTQESQEPGETSHAGTLAHAVGEAALEIAKTSIRQAVAQHFEGDLKALRTALRTQGISDVQQCIALVLHYVGQACADAGIPLDDKRIDCVFDEARGCAVQAADQWEQARGFCSESLAVQEALRGHMTTARPHASLSALHADEFSGTPFGRIPPQARILLYVPPCRLDPLERALSEIQASRNATDAVKAGRRNPFMALLFNNEAAYLGNMAAGWKMIMEALRAPEPELSPDFIGRLHATAAATTPSAGTAGVASNFPIPPGNYSPDGLKEASAFFEGLRSEHGIDVSFEPVNDLGKGMYGVVRAQTDKKVMDAVMASWIDEYKAETIKADGLPDHEKSDAKVLAAIDLCQKLKRLHPFRDGNMRTFSTLLLNYLLAQQGESLTAIEDRKKLDGYSRREVLALVRKGQERVRALEQEA